mgnify:FL=1
MDTLEYNCYFDRLEMAKIKGRNFFEQLDKSLQELPIDVQKIVEQNPNWSLFFSNLYGEDGYTIYKIKNNKKKYKICVDPYGMVERIRFTIAHEIGHIVLGHFEEYSNMLLTDEEAYILDKEADMFAGEILMPYKYMLIYHNWSIKGLTYRFHVSKEAVKVRLSVLEKDKTFIRAINGYY